MRAQRALAREAHSGRSQASAAHVMPSATSWSALGVIMSGLCQPTLCQPRSSTTTWCSSSSSCSARASEAALPGAQSGAREQHAAEQKPVALSLTMTMCGLELKSGMEDAAAVVIRARLASSYIVSATCLNARPKAALRLGALSSLLGTPPFAIVDAKRPRMGPPRGV